MSINHLHRRDPDFDQLYVFGAGGHGREIRWLAEQCWGDRVNVEFLVDRPEYAHAAVDGCSVQLLQDLQPPANARYVVALGNSRERARAASACDAVGLMAAALVHPRVEASRYVSLGDGSVVCAGSVLTTQVRLGIHVHVNVHCSASHDVVIGDFTTLSPGVHVSGNVWIGTHVFFGTGACVINGEPGTPLLIGDGAIIAAGACVTRHVESGALVAGVPAVQKRPTPGV